MELDGERARKDKEKFVGVFMRVPHEAAGHFSDFDIVVVQRGDAFGRPEVVEEGERVNDIDRFVCVGHRGLC